MSMSLTCCWSWDEIWWDLMAKININIIHLLFVMGCDETSRQINGSATHNLLVMGWDVIRMHGRNTTHILLVKGWDVMRMQGRNKCQCHSHPGIRVIRLPQLAEINVSVTHILLVMGWDVMRLHSRNFINVNVTHKLFVMGWDVMRLPHGRAKCQFHSHPVGHRMRCDGNAWQK